MQRIRQEYFKDRALYYTSRLIERQLPKGKAYNNYQLPEVYLIALLEFRMEEEKREQYFHDIALADKSTSEIFYRKLGFKFIQLPNFAKEEEELSSERDKRFYVLKHMSKMEKMPKFLDKRVFRLIFKIGEVSKLKKEERMAYEASLKAKWDTQNAFDSVRREATEKKSYDVVENLIIKLRLSDEQVAEIAEVSIDFVEKVRADLAKKQKN